MKKISICLFAIGALVGAGSGDSITPERLLAHIKILASDEFAGRGPGTPGEDKTVAYIVDQAKSMGLEPGNPDGTFIQKVPLWGVRSKGTLQITGMVMISGEDYLAYSLQPKTDVAVADSAIVFVGYGVTAPQYRWDDYRGIDVKGKTVVVLSGDPPVMDPVNPKKFNDKIFNGVGLSVFGRPGTKFDTAFAHGAAAVMLVYAPRNGATNLAAMANNIGRENMILRDQDDVKRVSALGYITAAKTKELFAASGLDFEALRTDAVKRSFKAVELKAKATFQITNAVREISSANVIAKVAGSDAKLKNEYVIYSGHWDHLGQEGDRIFHGASDNAAGTAGVLELARAFTTLKPKRTVLFLWPTAEEKGLLGAKYYVEAPLYPLKATVANINLDYFSNWGWGRTHDISIVGLGNSTLDDLVIAAAKRQGRVVTGDTAPEEGFYFRSDHFEFNKGGVPSLETSPGVDYIGKPAGYGVDIRTTYIRNDYHKTSDEPKPGWDLTGAVEDLQVLLETGVHAADDAARPVWKKNAPYKF
jgi:Zn-dependent M28 family amino/carboxypeptidase